MRYFILVLAFALARVATAETSLACWDAYAKKGSRPTLKADIFNNDYLKNISFDFGSKDEGIFAPYFSQREDKGNFSLLADPDPANVQANEIITKHSPYFSNNEFALSLGKWHWYDEDGTYAARLILPKDLSNENLKDFRFKNRANDRVNGVLIIPPVVASGTGGDTYVKLFCTSK
jgi:hypothetical protein